ncbi:RmlC-like cupin, partial [Aspergillus ellipticus CBS 707.79]
PLILPPTTIAALPHESFPTPGHGDVTWQTLFTQPTTATSDLSAGIAVCPPRTGHLCAHRHAQAEMYYVLEGKGVVTVDGTAYEVGKGAAVFIPGDAEHSVVNVADEEGEELRWLYVFGCARLEDVVYRFSGGGG